MSFPSCNLKGSKIPTQILDKFRYVLEEGCDAKEKTDNTVEIDYTDDSIEISNTAGQFLIIFKKNIGEIWYSSPISGALRFAIMNQFNDESDNVHMANTGKAKYCLVPDHNGKTLQTYLKDELGIDVNLIICTP